MNDKKFTHKQKPDKLTHLQVTEDTQLLKFLIDKLKGKSRTTVKSLLAHKQIYIRNQAVSQFDFPLSKGQEVTIHWGRVPEQVKLRGLRIIFEDQHLIVVEKASGMLSIATDKEKLLTAYSTLSDYVKRDDPDNKIFVIHRLDRDTSGVMMFAKSMEVQSELQRAWQEMIIRRTYTAVVEGNMETDEGTVRSWLKENKAYVMYSTNNPNDGDEAITHYKVIERSPNYTLLDLELETGRKNQIRVHMKDIGHSIVGDRKYGAKLNPIRRVALHAHVLEFVHPITGREMYFDSTIPGSFNSLLRNDKPLV